jgi:hypothetical protein
MVQLSAMAPWRLMRPGRTQAGGAALRAGRYDRTERFRAEREADQSRRRRRSGTGGRSARTLLEIPRVLGASLKPEVALGQCAHRKLGNQDRARLIEPLDHSGVAGRDAILEGLGAPGGRDALGVEEVLHAVRDAVERAAILPGADLLIGGGRLFERQALGEGHEAQQLGPVLLHAGQVHLCQVGGRHRARADQRCDARDRPEGQLLEIRRRLMRRAVGKGDRRGEALGTVDGCAIGQSGMEGEGRFGAVGNIDLAESFVANEGGIDAPQHHLELVVLEFEAEDDERADDLFPGDAHRLLGRGTLGLGAAARCRRLLRCRRSDREQPQKLDPGSSVHKLP